MGSEGMKKHTQIVVRGARVHNLKNVSVRIPRNAITVITGLSGSGKSSLAFDTIYAEGQRRYVESLSSYARQFFDHIRKPDVDLIEGLAPAISIDQRSAAQTPRSTVGTMSEIYDYLRLLFARIGTAYCPQCQTKLTKERVEQAARATRLHRHSLKHRMITQLRCPEGHGPFPELTLSSFSFNSPQGACPQCHGLGMRWELEPNLVIPNPRLTLAEGAIRPWSRLGNQGQAARKFLAMFETVTGASRNTPVMGLDSTTLRELLYGREDSTFVGVLAFLEERYRSTDSTYVRGEIERYMVERQCGTCLGQRLRPEALAVRVADQTIIEMTRMTIAEATSHFTRLMDQLPASVHLIARPIVDDVSARLGYLQRVGLQYLTLDRAADTLAGGEAQRIRLATQLGSGLTGVLYVLDEPSIGLHPKDLDRLIETIEELRDLENTVIVVEHDAQMIKRADYVIDIGPGAGAHGGQIVAQGDYESFLQSNGLTAQYLRGDRQISLPQARRRRPGQPELRIVGARSRNLRNLNVTIPLEAFTCVTGVSGSGKSTLVREVLAKSLAAHFHRAKAVPGAHTAIEGLEHIDKIIHVDQSPIGRTPRSNPATYTNVFGAIRELFAQTPLAVQRKYDAGHFSFNVKGGRCEVCRGDGVIKHEMHFLPDVFVTCDACGGTRYRPEILDITWADKTIADILALSIEEANQFFSGQPAITGKLGVLVAVGLGYLELGQPATTLSGGEAQRVKLATELARQSTGSTFYILDEPTTGLHFEDVLHLLSVLQALVNKGNSVLVIEHNLDVIKSADYVIDLGPGGGDEGGFVVAAGTPEEIARVPESATGQYLKPLLSQARSTRSAGRIRSKRPELAVAA